MTPVVSEQEPPKDVGKGILIAVVVLTIRIVFMMITIRLADRLRFEPNTSQ